MINVGVIGVGTEWEEYLPVLEMLRRPVGVRAVYDSVRARAEQAAVSLSATTATGLSQLAGRHDIQAMLLMEPGWSGESSLDVLSRCGKPVFIRPWLTASASFYERHFDRASQAGLMLMPAMWRRFMPSTMRLQELFATDLGKPLRLELHLDLPTCPARTAEQLVGWLDFSRNLFRAYPDGARLESTGERSLRLLVEYPSRDATTPHRQASLTVSAQDCDAGQLRRRLREAVSDCRASNDVSLNGHAPLARELRFPEITCECESGRATLLDRTSLTWRSHGDEGDGAGVRTKEELSAERTEAQVMLDLFCRRLVGGLVPVADFSDISRALRLVESVLSF
jgi:predicted dehydrogenase